jgi:hypothetical protein
MNPLSPSTFLRLGLAGVTALVLAAPAGAGVMRVDAGNGMVGRYGWGATATLAKTTSNDLVAQYGWGAAAAYAKLHA